jgi:hypothetical protein
MKNPRPQYEKYLPTCVGKKPLVLDKDGAVTIEVAAEFFDMDVRKLRGLIHGNEWMRPIGGLKTGTVYPWSIDRYFYYQDKIATAAREQPPASGTE